MNERIKELTVQAGLKIEYQMINPPKPLQILGSAEQFEKFAELIVRSCALTAGLMEQDGRKGIGAAILDNYGIE